MDSIKLKSVNAILKSCMTPTPEKHKTANDIKRYRKLTQTYIPASVDELKQIRMKNLAMEFIDRSTETQTKLSKTKYCKEKHISMTTLNNSLELLKIRPVYNAFEKRSETIRAAKTNREKSQHVQTNTYTAGNTNQNTLNEKNIDQHTLVDFDLNRC